MNVPRCLVVCALCRIAHLFLKVMFNRTFPYFRNKTYVKSIFKRAREKEGEGLANFIYIASGGKKSFFGHNQWSEIENTKQRHYFVSGSDSQMYSDSTKLYLRLLIL